MHEPWIPHFGNNVPYTTREQDRVDELREQLRRAEEELEHDRSNRD